MIRHRTITFCFALAFGLFIGCEPSPGSEDETTDAASDSASDAVDDAADTDLDSGDADSSTDVDDVDSDDEQNACSHTCQLKFSCNAGVVYEHPNCAGSEQQCNSRTEATQVDECDEGCALFENYRDWPVVERPSDMCEENRPRGVGERCEDDTDCEPLDPDSSGNTLECDPDSGTCVDPTVPEYLEYCDVTASELASGDGFIEAPSAGFAGCSDASYCIVDKDAIETCQSCSIPCETPADCPSGSTCDSIPGLDSTTETVKLCTPQTGPLYPADVVECRPAE